MFSTTVKTSTFKLKSVVCIAALAMGLTACDDDSLNIGNSLTSSADKLSVASASFDVATQTILADSVLSRSSTCYFGRIKDPETGAYVTSDVMAQFHLLESFALPDEGDFLSRDGLLAGADSCELLLYVDQLFNKADTVSAMKMKVSELAHPTEEGQLFYSNYDPVAEGLVRDGGLTLSKMFTYADLTVKDSLRNTTNYYNNIRIPLKGRYQDKDGNEYNNYGTYIVQQYFRHPEYFKNSYNFLHHVCPGFFLEVTDGLGFHAQMPDMGLRVYFTGQEDTTVYQSIITLAATEEVIQTTRITNDKELLAQLAADNTCTYLKTPAGLFTEVTLPIDDVQSGHETDSLLSASITFQRINNTVHDNTTLPVPQYLLMVQKDSLENFFKNSELSNGRTSYYTAYSSSTNTYSFTNISNLVTIMGNQKVEGLKSDPNWVARHPNWNKVVLVPISLTITGASTYSTGTTTAMSHNLSLSSTRLVGGSASDTPIKLNVVYAKFQNK